jgi:hypothetical protein
MKASPVQSVSLGHQAPAPTRSSPRLPAGTFSDGELCLLVRDGKAFEGETAVQFIRAAGPTHFFRSQPPDARLVVDFEALEFPGRILKRYYPVRCRCRKPVLREKCPDWCPKGARSAFCQDASVALGRLPRNGDVLLPERLFPGRIFRARIAVVNTGQRQDPATGRPASLPQSAWHSKIAHLVLIEAGPKQA